MVQITLFFFHLQAQEGSSVSFLRYWKIKLFGMSLSLKILASGTASDQMPAFCILLERNLSSYQESFEGALDTVVISFLLQ